MALLLLSNRTIAKAGVRAVTLREVVVASIVLCFVAGVAGFAAGLIVGRNSVADLQAAAEPDPLREGYAMQRLGEMSARLLALENNASGLLRKLSGIEQVQGAFTKLEKSGAAPALTPKPVLNASKDGSGGPVMAPVCDSVSVPDAMQTSARDGVKRAEGTLACLQSVLQAIEKTAETRTLAYMSLPKQVPIPDVDLGSPFGNRVDPITGAVAFHPGLDFSAKYGTDIMSAGGGKVRFAGWHNELGNVIELDHGNGLISRYAHASRLLVKVGDVVAPGQKIAEVGSTGRSTGAHLHFEILHAGRYVDPLQYLNAVNKNAVASKR
ncbi:M23 family metallopeptidase [Viridibacterium curvum]|uniref:M23ase beta-sheet core domain-containing protein n=1 Tax=Viridibacterium curvum TaxID=1101404 RepID=A0ABP9QGC6_9RHOO